MSKGRTEEGDYVVRRTRGHKLQVSKGHTGVAKCPETENMLLNPTAILRSRETNLTWPRGIARLVTYLSLSPYQRRVRGDLTKELEVPALSTEK